MQWEAELEEYEKDRRVSLQDQAKTAAVLSALTGAMEQHAQLNTGTLDHV